jgi:glucose-1-phosphate thymidylyltransferase
MKGLILAAGRGTRLGGLTAKRSKALVPLANLPLIAYPIAKLLELGIREIGIVAGSNEAELRTGLEQLQRQPAFGSASFSFTRQDQPLGLAHAVSCARDFCADDDFILLFCDNLFEASLELSEFHWHELRAAHGDCALIHTVIAPDPRACGVVVVDEEGYVIELEEKPQQPKSNLAIAGLYLFSPAIFDAIARVKPSFRGELEITDAISELIALGHPVKSLPLEGFWYDTGTVQHLIEAHGPVLGKFGDFSMQSPLQDCRASGAVGTGPDSHVRGCAMEGPVLIGAGCQLSDCRLGPNVSVGDGCELMDCTLQDVQVYAGTRLRGVEASNAIFDGDGVYSID